MRGRPEIPNLYKAFTFAPTEQVFFTDFFDENRFK
jgi:hypothetical protein